MSTAEERRFRVERRIMPIKVTIKQADGSASVQHVDADVRRGKPTLKHEEELACQEVRSALNRYYYEGCNS